MNKCRICENNYSPFISFGNQPIANGFTEKQSVPSEYFFELAVGHCSACSTVQLIDQPKREQMFNENYAFFSSTSKYMQTHFANIAEKMKNEFLKDSSSPFVVEMGSNDGIMLQNFSNWKIKHLGIEPSANVAQAAMAKGVETWNKFFDEDVAQDIVNQKGQADVFFTANVMCHIPYINSVAKGIKKLLKPQGVLVFEDPYLGSILEKTSYDQIYDEHVYFFSLVSVKNIFARFGLELFHAEPLDVHGGSMRYFLGHPGAHKISSYVSEKMDYELNTLKINQAETYTKFRQNVEKSRDDLVACLKKLKAEGKRVVGYGATSKSTTVLNYCQIGPELIEFISDTTPTKIGKYTPGMHIPVKSPDNFHAKLPEVTLLFAWNHKKEIMEKEKQFSASGGQWLTYVPEVHLFQERV